MTEFPPALSPKMVTFCAGGIGGPCESCTDTLRCWGLQRCRGLARVHWGTHRGVAPERPDILVGNELSSTNRETV
jgi:hypothetical protein